MQWGNKFSLSHPHGYVRRNAAAVTKQWFPVRWVDLCCGDGTYRSFQDGAGALTGVHQLLLDKNTHTHVRTVKFASPLRQKRRKKENRTRKKNTIVINYRTYLVYCVDETSFSLFTSKNKQKVRLNISKVTILSGVIL